jgi:MinD-like ATPase involved in chromosome partitioning or flagellar assembly
VDFDIEGGGLHMILRVDDNRQDSIQQWLMHPDDHRKYLGDVDPPNYEDSDTFMERLIIDTGAKSGAAWASELCTGGSVFLIQAKPDARATAYVDTGMNLFYRFRKLLTRFESRAALDYLLIDCRSGISNLALPGLAYCHGAVVFLRWGIQHRLGTRQLISWYREWQEEAGVNIPIFVVASGLHHGEVDTAGLGNFCESDLPTMTCGSSVLPFVDTLTRDDGILLNSEDPMAESAFESLTERLIEVVNNAG